MIIIICMPLFVVDSLSDVYLAIARAHNFDTSNVYVGWSGLQFLNFNWLLKQSCFNLKILTSINFLRSNIRFFHSCKAGTCIYSIIFFVTQASWRDNITYFN